jgi:hypothetical protein
MFKIFGHNFSYKKDISCLQNKEKGKDATMALGTERQEKDSEEA